MTFTSHGHYIPGTPVTNDPPENRARCGGVRICLKCKNEAVEMIMKNLKELTETAQYADGGHDYVGVDSESKSAPQPFSVSDAARRSVYKFINDEASNSEYSKFVKDHYASIKLDDIYVVWSCFILGCWKALVSTNRNDSMYYEVTYNVEANDIYVDAYQKIKNVAYAPNEI